MQLKEFDYNLPQELIAQEPLKERDQSRLMVLNRKEHTIEHARFYDLPQFLGRGDLLVANDTRVIPARLYGRKDTGGRVELLLLRFLENGSDGSQTWECLLHSRRRPHRESTLYFSQCLSGEVLESLGSGRWRVRLQHQGGFADALNAVGKTPLPPYIKRQSDAQQEALDRERYQTIYAAASGAVAAPTAGLHFTQQLTDKIRLAGAEFVFLTLHVGLGTFQPIREEFIEDHVLHEEFFHLSPAAAQQINQARRAGGRIICIGTTATRTIETVADSTSMVRPAEGFTDLYIYPGYRFKAVDALITNFHLPKSSLLLLVSAFAGKEFIRRAYGEAVKEKYRFYSYGDAMLIV